MSRPVCKFRWQQLRNPHLTTLAEGTRVLFDIRQDARGKKEAVNVPLGRFEASMGSEQFC